MSLNIIKAGICDTFQDLGRKGLQHLGINPGGAMDLLSMQTANILAGNPADTEVLEMHFPAATILFEKPVLLVIGGADFTPEINGQPVPLLQPVWAPAHSTLSFRRRKSGSWCYLALHGGFAIEPWLNSYSTHLKAGAGGWNGRPLQKEDHIPFGYQGTLLHTFSGIGPETLPWRAVPWQDPYTPGEICMVDGPETAWLEDSSLKLLQSETFTLLPASDRMAYNLQGPALISKVTTQLISAAVTRGTLQLLPDGQVIVLMADHQTTGGYPRVGQVIQAHIPKLAQCRPGDQIRFIRVTLQQAQHLWLQQHRYLQQLESGVRFKTETLKLLA